MVMMHTNEIACPFLDGLLAAGWHIESNGKMTVCNVPSALGYGSIQLLRPQEGMAAIRTDLYLYQPYELSSWDPFPEEMRSLQFIYDVDEDDGVICSVGRSLPTVFPSERAVKIVTLAYAHQEFRSSLRKRYVQDADVALQVLQNLPAKIKTEFVRALFRTIGQERDVKGQVALRLVSSRMHRFLFYLTNNTHEFCSGCGENSSCHDEDHMGLCAVATYFKKHPDESLSIEQLSCMAGMSPTKLKTLFKKEYGDTLYGFLRTVRMNTADEYLRDGLSVTDAAQAVGYKSVNRFSEAYRNTFGRYPGKVKASVT